MVKNTLNFYNNIYDPLVSDNYGKSLDRSVPSLNTFKKFSKQNNIKINSVIDVGCRWGKALEYWKNKGVKSTGVDVSKKIVKYCKNRGLKCYLASATDLSIFKDKQFDLYMATDVYEHLKSEDLKYAIKEAKRITKKYLLIRPHPALDRRGRQDKSKALHLTVWSLKKWKEFFEKYNLNIIGYGNKYTDYKNTFIMEIKENNNA